MLKIERTYRDQWRPSSTLMLAELVAKIPAPHSDELLVRLIQTDMELGILNSRKPTLHSSSSTASLASATNLNEEDDDDERVIPRLELYLLRFPQLRERWEWLSQLIVFEFTLLSNSNYGRSVDYYCDLFPQFSSSITELLRRIEVNLQRHSSTIVTYRGRVNPSDTTTVAASEDTGSTWILPRTLGRYYLLSFVDSGGMGNVFRALDMKRGTLVAIKVMRRDDTWSIYQFNQEFRTLAKIRHPNLVRMYDAFSETGLRYFSMELITGCDIGRWAAENRQQRHFYSRLRMYLKQLISVIHHLHQHGVVHRDIKPSNVLLRSPHCAVLLDCSLVQRWDKASDTANQSEHEDVVGTLCYMAPEVLARQATTPASDWYSLGVMLYELLTGDFPIPPANDVDEQRFNQEFEQRLETLAPNIPIDLRQLCLSLLQKIPSARPAGAAIAQLMGTTTSTPMRSIKPLIGRGANISSILQTLNSDTPTTKPLILYGEPGIGLSAILDQVCEGFPETKNNLIIRVGGLKQDRTPHSIVTPLLHSLLDALRFRDRDHWRPTLLKYMPEIAPHFQEIVLQDEVRNIELSNTVSKTDSLTAVTNLLAALSQQQRLIIVVDDLQWCDSESINFLVEQIFALPTCNSRLLASCVCAIARGGFHDSAYNKSPVLEELEQKQRIQSIHIPPLGTADMRRLLRELARDSDNWSEQQLEDIYRGSNGNPGRLRHILRYFTDGPNSLSLQSGDYQFTYYRWHQTELSTLSKLARKMMQFLACAYQPLKLVTLERLLKASPDKLQEAQEELELGRWIVTTESSDGIWLTLADSNLRPVILDTLPPATLKRRHHRLAQCLITLHDSPWLLIGYHYQASGSYSRAMDAFSEAQRTAKTATDLAAVNFAIQQLENRNYHNS